MPPRLLEPCARDALAACVAVAPELGQRELDERHRIARRVKLREDVGANRFVLEAIPVGAERLVEDVAPGDVAEGLEQDRAADDRLAERSEGEHVLEHVAAQGDDRPHAGERLFGGAQQKSTAKRRLGPSGTSASSSS